MTHIRTIFIALLILTLHLSAVLAMQANNSTGYTVTVTAGAFDREEAIVSFTFPERINDGIYQMHNGSDGFVHLQVQDNRGWFILNHLKAGASKKYTLEKKVLSEGTPSSQVTHYYHSPNLVFRSGGNEVLSYFYQENELPEEVNPIYKRSGYIHPVYTPRGTMVTNHLNPGAEHQYGLWMAWSGTEFQGRNPNFWGVRTGRVIADSLEKVWKGHVHGGFRAKHRYVDITGSSPVTALNEQWEVIIYQPVSNKRYHIFDINIIQTTNTGNPLVISEHIYGGISLRGSAEWNVVGKLDFLTSEGLNREEGDGTRARWSHLGGLVDGRLAGIGVLGHPDNYRHPQAVRMNPGAPFF